MTTSSGNAAEARTVTAAHVLAALDQITQLVEGIRRTIADLPRDTILTTDDTGPTRPPIAGNCPPPDGIHSADPNTPKPPVVAGNCPSPEVTPREPDAK